MSECRRLMAGSTVLCIVTAMGMVDPATAGDEFTRFAGSWHGGGSISMADGSHEAIRCKATYAVRPDGQAMNVDMNCASDSYKVHILTQVVSDGSGFSGAWQETTRQVQGTVTGRATSPGDMSADFQASVVDLHLAARTNGQRQNINLHASGADVREVSINLSR